MKTKNKTLFAVLFLITAMISCDTDRLPETAIADASYWKSESDLKMAANYLYTSLPNVSISADLMSDDSFGTASNSISDGSRNVPATDGNYNNNYGFIRAANKLIENAPKVLANGVAATNVNWYVGEAKYFRARAYYNLLQRYGGVPLILKVLDENSPELQAPQNTRDEVVNAIYADLDDAVSKLRTASVLSSTTYASYGRISQTAALSLKAEVALFEGTRSKFHGYGDPIKHLTIARNAAKAVMDSKEHSLFNTASGGNTAYFNLLQYAGEGSGNKENILVNQYGKSVADVVVSHNTIAEIDNGRYGQTQSLVDAYLMKDGLPYTKSPLYVAPNATTTKAKDLYTNRDPRMSDRFFKTGDPYNIGVAFSVPNSFMVSKYAYRGYFNDVDRAAGRSFIDYPITRYAEILLIYAEASFELNGTISDADLDLSINLLRARAAMPKLTNAFVTANGLDMRTEIRRERRVELSLEGFRYWDLIRWKTAEIELPKTVLGSYWYAEFGKAPATLDSNSYIILQANTKRKFDPARDYLWPFPTNELGLNPNLKQNPNW
ncbi:RagB/SusD family nutrient uptake outer membrane protein [Flavobacterium gilvum]|uniref:RagB/SusD family nutrient uptake outer membrane protein n=1 Tax=Flavobacterium gilvum TaxID=1492737 RepID=A0AAC9I2Y9_9FLAO|nr:RagB/SusD family nutrient uptake outer membrane protein [Flavobacterium gilvum]AOW08580.1 RagB/SusD family nutrient uptake outer membrane protein [Flavobacterium gilvum]KFC58429.1 carbohydrate-binding protein SusD [Flavobacterium gilvum]